MTSPLAVPGRSHSQASTIDLVEEFHRHGVVSITVKVWRPMHLNPPLLDPARTLKKKVSWWNIGAQETRAEAINAIEKHLKRELDTWEYEHLTSSSTLTPLGIETTVKTYKHLED